MFEMIGSLFGGSKVVDKSLDMIEKAIYTKQEIADDSIKSSELKAKASQAKMDFVIRYQIATQGQNLTRRFIAIMISGLYVTYTLIILGLSINNVYYGTENSKEVLTILTTSFLPISGVFGVIIAFYFKNGQAKTGVN